MDDNHKVNVSPKPLWGELILQGMPELTYVFDREGKMIRWNKNIETVLGYSGSGDKIFVQQEIK